ncbi:MAG: hypothetical protein R2787_03890 [Saprospiraceae bacterium]
MNCLTNGHTVIHGTIGPDLHPKDSSTLCRQITLAVDLDPQVLIVTTTPETAIQEEDQ